MRDPVRIQRILNKVSIIWNAFPDFRFGQLFVVAGYPASERNPFYLEDEEFEKLLDKWIKDNNLENGWKS